MQSLIHSSSKARKLLGDLHSGSRKDALIYLVQASFRPGPELKLKIVTTLKLSEVPIQKFSLISFWVFLG